MAAPQPNFPLATPDPGWRRARLAPSLAEVYRSVPVSAGAWWRKALAFAGPGYLVAVGYMDPGVRPGGGDRVGDRVELVVRDSAAVGHCDHGARRADRAVLAAPGLPAARGARRGADRDHRGLLPVRDR